MVTNQNIINVLNELIPRCTCCGRFACYYSQGYEMDIWLCERHQEYGEDGPGLEQRTVAHAIQLLEEMDPDHEGFNSRYSEMYSTPIKKIQKSFLKMLCELIPLRRK